MAIILCPVRELANQIFEEAKKLSQFHPVSLYLCCGGVRKKVPEELRELEELMPNIIVATPGRLLNNLEQGFKNHVSTLEVRRYS